MEPKSSLTHSIPSDLNGHHRTGYEGAITSEHITSKQRHGSTGRNKSKVRLNDQLIPKPTDINIAEKMIKTATPKEHPYASHISRFAMFPSFRSPDDPQTGVRAASQAFLNPLVPNGVPDVTLLSKTIGSPYRHEVLEAPMKTRKKAVMWAGEHGFLDHAKPVKGEKQVFYPTPPKTVLPNPKLRDWDLSLSERTSNMLKNLERTHWLTSYQMHHTGSGPANPLKIDDFMEKSCDNTSHTAPLRERSFPTFVPSKPRSGCRRRQRSICSPAAAELTPDRSPAPYQGTASATINQRGPQEMTAKCNEAPEPNQKGYSQSKHHSGSTEAQSTEPSQEVSHKQQTERKSSAYEGSERENCKVQFDDSAMSQIIQEANAARIAAPERLLDLNNHPLSQEEIEVNGEKSQIKLCGKDEPSSIKDYFKAGRNVSGVEERLAKGRELPHSISNTYILPRPPLLPGIAPLGRAGSVGREGAALCLLDLQNSFSKSNAHRNFNNSVTRAAVNLRDNVVMGKKHDFYGINSYYLHG